MKNDITLREKAGFQELDMEPFEEFKRPGNTYLQWLFHSHPRMSRVRMNCGGRLKLFLN